MLSTLFGKRKHSWVKNNDTKSDMLSASKSYKCSIRKNIQNYKREIRKHITHMKSKSPKALRTYIKSINKPKSKTA